ncbi:MAG: hypothetical protein H7835_02790 [Magnetococcus sp. XQGC-1]
MGCHGSCAAGCGELWQVGQVVAWLEVVGTSGGVEMLVGVAGNGGMKMLVRVAAVVPARQEVTPWPDRLVHFGRPRTPG